MDSATVAAKELAEREKTCPSGPGTVHTVYLSQCWTFFSGFWGTLEALKF